MRQAPVRICCGTRHWSVQCPDGLTMCILCFDRFPESELFRDAGGVWDICQACARLEAEHKGGTI